MSSLLFCSRHLANSEEQMLLAEDGPDLIHSLDPRRCCNINAGGSANYKCGEEKNECLAIYESLDYLPSHSEAYKKWLQEKAYR